MSISVRTHSSDEALVESRRNHIASCSIKLLTKRGYHRTTVRDLAKASGISIGLFYHYFGSKEELLFSILKKATTQQAFEVSSFVQGLDLDPRETLVHLIREFFRWHDTNQDVTLWVYQETKNLPEDAQDEILESENQIVSVFEKVLRKGIESKAFKAIDATMVAHTIVVLGHSWAVRRWFLQKRYTLEEYTSHQVDFIMQAVSEDVTAGK